MGWWFGRQVGGNEVSDQCHLVHMSRSHLKTPALKTEDLSKKSVALVKRKKWIYRRTLKVGAKQRGGGSKTSRGDPPPGKQFPTPLTSVRSPPPPNAISLMKSLSSGDPLKNSLRRVSKNGCQGAILARFRFATPPVVSPPLWLGPVY